MYYHRWLIFEGIIAERLEEQIMINAKVQHGVAIIPKDKKEVIVELKHAVNLKQAFIVPGGSIFGGDGYNGSYFWDVRIALVDNKHMSIKRAYPSAYTAEVSWQVVYWGEPEPEQEDEPEIIDWDNDIDWTKVPMDTEVLVSNCDTSWKKRYFLCYLPDTKRYRTFGYGEASSKAYSISGWARCQLANDEDIEKYKKVKDNE